MNKNKLEWLACFLIVSHKFVHQLLGLISQKIPANGFSTMGVGVDESGKFTLVYDPGILEKYSDAELTYMLYHEVLHIALHHCTSRLLTQDKRYKHIANIASDLAVNELIPEGKDCKRPAIDGKVVGCFVEEFRKMPEFRDIKSLQTAEWYYKYLLERVKDSPPQQQGDGGGNGNESKNENGGKECAVIVTKKENKSIKVKRHDNHDEWKEHQIADEKVRHIISKIERENIWGNMSDSVKEVVLAAQIRKIHWKGRVRTIIGNYTTREREYTWKRPNRRTGFMHPGTKKQYVDKVLVAIDTSGSIDNELASEFVGVLNQLVDIYPMDVMQFDASITEKPHLYDRRKDKVTFTGRGGTDFQPVIDLIDSSSYKIALIVTDGCASAPTKPKYCKIIWVMPEGCTPCSPEVTWGERIYISK